MKKASTNKAHEALASFSLQQTRDRLMPSNIGSTFTLITQNIDGLSQQALDRQSSRGGIVFNSENTSQPPLYEMHGRLFEVVCTNELCERVVFDTTSPLVPALDSTEKDVDGNHIEKNIPLEELPRCSKCGSLARPGVVWFGEMPRHLDEIDDLVAKADLCLVIGTSSTVRSFHT